jgi:hypothetical protein
MSLSLNNGSNLVIQDPAGTVTIPRNQIPTNGPTTLPVPGTGTPATPPTVGEWATTGETTFTIKDADGSTRTLSPEAFAEEFPGVSFPTPNTVLDPNDPNARTQQGVSGTLYSVNGQNFANREALEAYGRENNLGELNAAGTAFTKPGGTSPVEVNQTLITQQLQAQGRDPNSFTQVGQPTVDANGVTTVKLTGPSVLSDAEKIEPGAPVNHNGNISEPTLTGDGNITFINQSSTANNNTVTVTPQDLITRTSTVDPNNFAGGVTLPVPTSDGGVRFLFDDNPTADGLNGITLNADGSFGSVDIKTTEQLNSGNNFAVIEYKDNGQDRLAVRLPGTEAPVVSLEELREMEGTNGVPVGITDAILAGKGGREHSLASIGGVFTAEELTLTFPPNTLPPEELPVELLTAIREELEKRPVTPGEPGEDPAVVSLDVEQIAPQTNRSYQMPIELPSIDSLSADGTAFTVEANAEQPLWKTYHYDIGELTLVVTNPRSDNNANAELPPGFYEDIPESVMAAYGGELVPLRTLVREGVEFDSAPIVLESLFSENAHKAVITHAGQGPNAGFAVIRTANAEDADQIDHFFDAQLAYHVRGQDINDPVAYQAALDKAYQAVQERYGADDGLPNMAYFDGAIADNLSGENFDLGTFVRGAVRVEGESFSYDRVNFAMLEGVTADGQPVIGVGTDATNPEFWDTSKVVAAAELTGAYNSPEALAAIADRAAEYGDFDWSNTNETLRQLLLLHPEVFITPEDIQPAGYFGDVNKDGVREQLRAPSIQPGEAYEDATGADPAEVTPLPELIREEVQ